MSDPTPSVYICSFVNRVSISEDVYPETDVEVEKILDDIAVSGCLCLDWKKFIRPLLACKTHQEFSQFSKTYGFTGPSYETFESKRKEVLDLLNSLDNAPFTLQRLAELIQKPTASYTSTHKFMNGVLKLLSVTSPLSIPEALHQDSDSELLPGL